MSIKFDLVNNSVPLVVLDSALPNLLPVNTVTSLVLDFKDRDTDPVSFIQYIYTNGIITDYTGYLVSMDVQHSDSEISGFTSVPPDLISELPQFPFDFSKNIDPLGDGFLFKFSLLDGHKRYVRVVTQYVLSGEGANWVDEFNNNWIDEFGNLWVSDDYIDQIVPSLSMIVYYQPYILKPTNMVQP